MSPEERRAVGRRLLGYARVYATNARHFPRSSSISAGMAQRAADCQAAAYELAPDLALEVDLGPPPLLIQGVAAPDDPGPEDAAAARAAPVPMPAPPPADVPLPTETLRAALVTAETVMARRPDDAAPALAEPVEVLRETIAAREAQTEAQP